MQFLYLDTETTGFHQPRILSIAWNVHGSFMYRMGFFNPPCEISEGATAVHGITKDMLKNCKPFNESIDSVHLQKVLNESILIAHMAAFDKRVLENEGLKVPKSLCTRDLSKEVLPGYSSYALQDLREALKLEPEIESCALPHTALGDVLILKALFKTLTSGVYQEFGQKGIEDLIQNFIVSST